MAADQHLLEYFTAMDNQGNVVVKEPPKFDLDLYISNYKGRTRFDRLLLIGQSSVPLCVDALKAAIAEAKGGVDIQRYRDAWECIRIAAPNEPEAKWDDHWVLSTEKANKSKTQRLEQELKGYKNNLIKESIRIGHRDLGEHLEAIGDLSAASDTYYKMRPDASTHSHIQDISKHVMGVMIQRREWASILSSINKTAGINVTNEEMAADQPYYKVVAGLAQLGSTKYYEAAKCFLEVGEPALFHRYNNIATPNDVATYGGLLALASMDRSKLQSQVLDNSGFRMYLELEPHIRKAISMFISGRYAPCLAILESYRNDYLLDIHLQKHVSVLYSQIRDKCIVQYVYPFSCVTLDNMNAIFAKPGESIEKELIDMIKRGILNARINTIDKLLSTVSSNARVDMQREALQSIKLYEQEVIERLRRMGITAANLDVKGLQKGGGGGAGNLPGVGEIWADDARRPLNSADAMA
ncbi:26S proteasome subunit RPN7-domain-containing protein [Hypoxylon fragiforme]|uniref:26S proteasome subunit RPN7-domain-containing protein n=1 Tax=Hypoxylon fragiforme TaxID=63214 RepID=UPI0020C5E3CB|nr:26S proteasome subunit RPN7-domain-containing protein [Hypoxylon fragiforme]KAI2612472.1 26S proteasome subunit RPN7-domain-containing protein [Hypoxylon fragiforme]